MFLYSTLEAAELDNGFLPLNSRNLNARRNRNPRSLKYGKIKLYTSERFICKTKKSPFRLCVEKRRFSEKMITADNKISLAYSSQ